MESRTKSAQGHVELRGEDEQEECGQELHTVVEQAETDLYSDEGSTNGGEHFQRKRGEEGDTQHTECRVAILFRDFGNVLCLSL